jgi:TonB-linked SusC/RagA family outer membrane protein
VFMLTGALAFSQNRVVTGKVTTVDGAAVPFASISVNGSKSAGAVADDNGAFSLKAKTGDVFTISGNGVNQGEVTVGASNFVSALLTRSNTELASVVVTSLGQKVNPKALGYAATKISGLDINKGKAVNLGAALSGKVAGVAIQNVSSDVFGETRITIRGIRSLTGNNQPMLILDGVPISLSYINSINPNDIESTTLLKSASSTAIYGPEGVNGAIVITMKKGQKVGSVVTLSHTTTFATIAYLPNFQTQYGSGSSVDANGIGIYDPIENQTYGDPFDGTVRELGRKDEKGNFFKTTYAAKPNEKKKFWDVGITNQTDLSFSAGGFYISAQKVGITGISPGDKNNRLSFSLSSSKEVGKFKAAFNTRYTQGKYNVSAGELFNGRDGSVYWNVVNTPIQVPLTQFKDWRNDHFSNPNYYFNDYYFNPYWIADNMRENGRTDDLLGNIDLNFKANESLNFTYRIGGTFTGNTTKATRGEFVYNDFARGSGKSNAQSNVNAAVRDGSTNSYRLNSEFFASYQKKVKNVTFNGILGHSFREIFSKSLRLTSTNLGVPQVFNVSVRKTDPTISEANSKSRLQRFFGRAGAGYKGWLFGEVTGSYDMDSRLVNPYDFANSDITFFYPGVNGSIILTEAIPALKNNVLNYVKIRGAISKTGNVNLSPYSFENTYSQTNGFPYSNSGANINGFTSDNTLRRTKYQPEFVINNELGVELGFWKNRILLEVNAYKQKNTNQLVTVDYSAATGYPKALLNAADFTNKGLEFDLKLTPLVNIGKVSIDVKTNFAIQTNVVNSIVDGIDELSVGNSNYVIKGKAAYTFKLTDYLRDPAGRIVVDKETGFPTLDPNLKSFGQTAPKYIFGLTTSVNWKNINLTVVGEYRGGNQIYSDIGQDLDFAGISERSGQYGRAPFIIPNSSIEVSPGKYEANTKVFTKSGGYDYWSTGVNTGAESNYISSGAFWKLREASLTYTFPAELFSTGVIKGANFSVVGRNLLTWLPKTNQWTDPEFSDNGTGNAIGVNSISNTPPTRTFGANLTLTF